MMMKVDDGPLVVVMMMMDDGGGDDDDDDDCRQLPHSSIVVYKYGISSCVR